MLIPEQHESIASLDLLIFGNAPLPDTEAYAKIEVTLKPGEYRLFKRIPGVPVQLILASFPILFDGE